MMAMPFLAGAQVTPAQTSCAIPANPTTASDWTPTVTCLMQRIFAIEARLAKMETQLGVGNAGVLPSIGAPTPALYPANPTSGSIPPNYGVPTPVGPYVGGSGSAGVGTAMVSPSMVTTVQNFLKAEGSFVYPTATGFFGPITREALKQFQEKQGLPASGEIDAATLNKMKMLAPTIAPGMSSQMQMITIPSVR